MEVCLVAIAIEEVVEHSKENLVAMELGEVAVVACLEVDATGIQSTAVEQIPVRKVETEDTQGVVDARVAVVVTAVVLEACVRFLIPDEVYRDVQFVAHVFYCLFRSFDETVLGIPSKLF